MSPSDPRATLRQAGLRVTGVRLDVLRALAEGPGALDAQTLFDRLGTRPTDRVTVYRTLHALVDAGLAHKVDPGDRIFRFSLTDHSRCEGDHHHDHEHPHLVCDACGTVECMDDAEVIIRRREAPTGRSSRAAAPAGGAWRVKQQSVTVRGTCGRCQQAEAASKGPRRHRRSGRAGGHS